MTKTRESPPSPLETADDAELVDWALIRGLVRFLLVGAPRRHRLLAAASFLAVVALAASAVFALPRRWEVQASILAQRNPLALELTPHGDAPHAAREFVLRRDNVQSIIAATNFIERHLASRAPAARARDWVLQRLVGPPTPERRLEDMIDGVSSKLWVKVGAEGTITFGFRWSNRQLAYDVVDAALRNFVEARHATEVASIGETISILESHAAAAQREIAAATKRLEDKQRALRGTEPERPRPVRAAVPPDEDLLRLDASLKAKRRALATMNEVRERRIAELRTELVQLENVYASEHPILIATRRNLEKLTAPAPEVDGLRFEIAELEREIRARGSRPGEATENASAGLERARLRLEEDDPRLEQEQLDLRLAFRHYSNLLVQIAEARVAQDTARAGFKYRYSVILPPQLPKAPVQPNVVRILVAGLLGGIALALFASAAADLRSGVLVERWQVEHGLGLPVLAELQGRPPRA